MKFNSVILLGLLCITSQASVADSRLADPVFNEIQSCQGLFNFVSTKLDSAPTSYSSEDIETIRRGLNGYDQYLQTTIITPELLKIANNDTAQADKFQKHIDAYKLGVIESLQQHYPLNQLSDDHAVSVNNCAGKALPTGNVLKDLTQALNAIFKLASLPKDNLDFQFIPKK